MSSVGCTDPSACRAPLRLAAIGTRESLGRRPSLITPVGPCGLISKWRVGTSYGRFRIGLLSAAATLSSGLTSFLYQTFSLSTSRRAFREGDWGRGHGGRGQVGPRPELP